MRETILQELKSVERECDVRVLLSVESGSRAWGMASDDSDYDVRFVYARSARDYLRLEKTRDTIEWKLDEVLDIAGWDLAKFLRLVRSSNPTAFEWLASPITYVDSPDFARAREVAARCFSPKASAFHYLGIANTNERALLSDVVSAKKYLYAVRALLAARWCLEERTPAPMLVNHLIDAKLVDSMRPCVEYLLAKKTAGDEHLQVERLPELDVWIEREGAELHAWAQRAPAPDKVAWDILDDAFAAIVAKG